MKEIDSCIVCGCEFTRNTSRQLTCLNPECQKEWKSGKQRTKVSKTYNCLKCGKTTTKGYICKECGKQNSKIQEWETW
jgi:hypothetical protein